MDSWLEGRGRGFMLAWVTAMAAISAPAFSWCLVLGLKPTTRSSGLQRSQGSTSDC